METENSQNMILPPDPSISIAPTPQVSPNLKKGHKGLVLVSLVIGMLIVMSLVTFIALQEPTNSGATLTNPLPTLVITKPAPASSELSKSDRTVDINKDLQQTTITDPATEVDGLDSDISQL